jgi:hypothetical protein
MKRDVAPAAKLFQHRQARPAGDHVIFSVNLKPKSRRRRGKGLTIMLGLEANTGGGSHGGYRATGVSEPLPLGVLIEAQVPFATYFQAFPP